MRIHRSLLLFSNCIKLKYVLHTFRPECQSQIKKQTILLWPCVENNIYM